jgi:hypothetical protein
MGLFTLLSIHLLLSVSPTRAETESVLFMAITTSPCLVEILVNMNNKWLLSLPLTVL